MTALEKIIIKTKPDTKKEKDDISEAQAEIKKYMAIIEAKKETIKLKKEQELRDSQEQKLIFARKELEQMIENINYFKHTAPFNQDLSFMKRLITFYNHLDKYEKSDLYKCESDDYVLFGKERELIHRAKDSGKDALDCLGDQTYRTLLKSFTDRFSSVEKELKKLAKAVNKK